MTSFNYWKSERFLHFISEECGLWLWMLTKRMEKNLDGNYTRTLRAILNKSWRQNPTKQHLYGHLPPITKTILWTPSHGRAKAGRPARTYIQQLCADTEWSPENLPKAMDDREAWRERVRNIRANSTTW